MKGMRDREREIVGSRREGKERKEKKRKYLFNKKIERLEKGQKLRGPRSE